MKLDALDHPKTHALTFHLDISRPTAIGHLELLWAFTGKNAPQGNIGKWENGAIARACDWAGDPDRFISALLAARFLDEDDEHRVSVHDWHEHAPGWVRAKLKGLNQQFISPKKAGSPRPTATGTAHGSPPGTGRGSPPADPGGEGLLSKGSEGKCSEEKRLSERESAPDGQPARSGEGSAKAKTPRGTRLPQDFTLTPERRAVAEAEGLDPERVFAAFADYWRAKPGAGGTKLDWDATWRNWCRMEADTHTPRRSAFAPPRIRTATEIAEEYEARERASANA